MQAFLPEGLSALSGIVRNWTFSLFYLMSELWGSVVVSVLVRTAYNKRDGLVVCDTVGRGIVGVGRYTAGTAVFFFFFCVLRFAFLHFERASK